MDVVDTKKLENAIIYLQRITEGHNPVNNMPAEEDSVLNNPNVIRCMYFIKDILEELRRNDGYIGRRPRKNRDDSKPDYPLENLAGFRYTGDKPITKLVAQLNELVDIGKYKKLTYDPIIKWLMKNGYLKEEIHQGSDKRKKVPTEKGSAAGIRGEKRTDEKGIVFIYIIYGQQAQELIVKNMAEILKEE